MYLNISTSDKTRTHGIFTNKKTNGCILVVKVERIYKQENKQTNKQTSTQTSRIFVERSFHLQTHKLISHLE